MAIIKDSDQRVRSYADPEWRSSVDARVKRAKKRDEEARKQWVVQHDPEGRAGAVANSYFRRTGKLPSPEKTYAFIEATESLNLKTQSDYDDILPDWIVDLPDDGEDLRPFDIIKPKISRRQVISRRSSGSPKQEPPKEKGTRFTEEESREAREGSPGERHKTTVERTRNRWDEQASFIGMQHLYADEVQFSTDENEDLIGGTELMDRATVAGIRRDLYDKPQSELTQDDRRMLYQIAVTLADRYDDDTYFSAEYKNDLKNVVWDDWFDEHFKRLVMEGALPYIILPEAMVEGSVTPEMLEMQEHAFKLVNWVTDGQIQKGDEVYEVLKALGIRGDVRSPNDVSEEYAAWLYSGFRNARKTEWGELQTIWQYAALFGEEFLPTAVREIYDGEMANGKWNEFTAYAFEQGGAEVKAGLVTENEAMSKWLWAQASAVVGESPGDWEEVRKVMFSTEEEADKLKEYGGGTAFEENRGIAKHVRFDEPDTKWTASVEAAEEAARAGAMLDARQTMAIVIPRVLQVEQELTEYVGWEERLMTEYEKNKNRLFLTYTMLSQLHAGAEKMGDSSTGGGMKGWLYAMNAPAVLISEAGNIESAWHLSGSKVESDPDKTYMKYFFEMQGWDWEEHATSLWVADFVYSIGSDVVLDIALTRGYKTGSSIAAAIARKVLSPKIVAKIAAAEAAKATAVAAAAQASRVPLGGVAKTAFARYDEAIAMATRPMWFDTTATALAKREQTSLGVAKLLNIKLGAEMDVTKRREILGIIKQIAGSKDADEIFELMNRLEFRHGARLNNGALMFKRNADYVRALDGNYHGRGGMRTIRRDGFFDPRFTETHTQMEKIGAYTTMGLERTPAAVKKAAELVRDYENRVLMLYGDEAIDSVAKFNNKAAELFDEFQDVILKNMHNTPAPKSAQKQLTKRLKKLGIDKAIRTRHDVYEALAILSSRRRHWGMGRARMFDPRFARDAGGEAVLIERSVIRKSSKAIASKKALIQRMEDVLKGLRKEKAPKGTIEAHKRELAAERELLRDLQTGVKTKAVPFMEGQLRNTIHYKIDPFRARASMGGSPQLFLETMQNTGIFLGYGPSVTQMNGLFRFMALTTLGFPFRALGIDEFWRPDNLKGLVHRFVRMKRTHASMQKLKSAGLMREHDVSEMVGMLKNFDTWHPVSPHDPDYTLMLNAHIAQLHNDVETIAREFLKLDPDDYDNTADLLKAFKEKATRLVESEGADGDRVRLSLEIMGRLREGAYLEPGAARALRLERNDRIMGAMADLKSVTDQLMEVDDAIEQTKRILGKDYKPVGFGQTRKAERAGYLRETYARPVTNEDYATARLAGRRSGASPRLTREELKRNPDLRAKVADAAGASTEKPYLVGRESVSIDDVQRAYPRSKVTDVTEDPFNPAFRVEHPNGRTTLIEQTTDLDAEIRMAGGLDIEGRRLGVFTLTDDEGREVLKADSVIFLSKATHAVDDAPYSMTMLHESFHDVQYAGILTDDEWKVLDRVFDGDFEKMAYAYNEWDGIADIPDVGGVFAKIRDWAKNFYNRLLRTDEYYENQAYKTFADVRSGDVWAREAGLPPTSAFADGPLNKVVTVTTKEFQYKAGKNATEKVEFVIRYSDASPDDFVPDPADITFLKPEDAARYNSQPARVADYQQIYAEAPRLERGNLFKTVLPTVNKKTGKTTATKIDYVPIIDLTQGCQRGTILRERIANGVLPFDTRIEGCYGTCWVDETQTVGYGKGYYGQLMEWRELRIANPDDFDFVISNPNRDGKLFREGIEKNGFVRHGQRGDDSHAFAFNPSGEEGDSIAAQWLEAMKRNDYGDTPNVFISSSYAPVTDAQYKRIASYGPKSHVVHFSVSGYFHPNELQIRFGEFLRAKRLGVNAKLRVVTNTDGVKLGSTKAARQAGSPPPMSQQDELLRMIREGIDDGTIKEGDILETPFHNDAIPKKGVEAKRSGPLKEDGKHVFESECCVTDYCKSCPAKCQIDGKAIRSTEGTIFDETSPIVQKIRSATPRKSNAMEQVTRAEKRGRTQEMAGRMRGRKKGERPPGTTGEKPLEPYTPPEPEPMSAQDWARPKAPGQRGGTLRHRETIPETRDLTDDEVIRIFGSVLNEPETRQRFVAAVNRARAAASDPKNGAKAYDDYAAAAAQRKEAVKSQSAAKSELWKAERSGRGKVSSALNDPVEDWIDEWAERFQLFMNDPELFKALREGRQLSKKDVQALRERMAAKHGGDMALGDMELPPVVGANPKGSWETQIPFLSRMAEIPGVGPYWWLDKMSNYIHDGTMLERFSHEYDRLTKLGFDSERATYRAYGYAEDFAERASYSNNMAGFEYAARNLVLFAPAYRQAAVYWGQLALKHPVIAMGLRDKLKNDWPALTIAGQKFNVPLPFWLTSDWTEMGIPGASPFIIVPLRAANFATGWTQNENGSWDYTGATKLDKYYERIPGLSFAGRGSPPTFQIDDLMWGLMPSLVDGGHQDTQLAAVVYSAFWMSLWRDPIKRNKLAMNIAEAQMSKGIKPDFSKAVEEMKESPWWYRAIDAIPVVQNPDAIAAAFTRMFSPSGRMQYAPNDLGDFKEVEGKPFWHSFWGDEPQSIADLKYEYSQVYGDEEKMQEILDRYPKFKAIKNYYDMTAEQRASFLAKDENLWIIPYVAGKNDYENGRTLIGGEYWLQRQAGLVRQKGLWGDGGYLEGVNVLFQNVGWDRTRATIDKDTKTASKSAKEFAKKAADAMAVSPAHRETMMNQWKYWANQWGGGTIPTEYEGSEYPPPAWLEAFAKRMGVYDDRFSWDMAAITQREYESYKTAGYSFVKDPEDSMRRPSQEGPYEITPQPEGVKDYYLNDVHRKQSDYTEMAGTVYRVTDAIAKFIDPKFARLVDPTQSVSAETIHEFQKDRDAWRERELLKVTKEEPWKRANPGEEYTKLGIAVDIPATNRAAIALNAVYYQYQRDTEGMDTYSDEYKARRAQFIAQRNAIWESRGGSIFRDGPAGRLLRSEYVRSADGKQIPEAYLEWVRRQMSQDRPDVGAISQRYLDRYYWNEPDPRVGTDAIGRGAWSSVLATAVMYRSEMVNTWNENMNATGVSPAANAAAPYVERLQGLVDEWRRRSKSFRTQWDRLGGDGLVTTFLDVQY